MHVKTTLAAARAITALEAQTDAEVSSTQDSKELDDILMSYLDAKHGDSVDAKNHAIFTKLTKRHEDRFMEDMRALNVRDPDDVTRVTEYVPRIVDFISKIQGNGFAYQVPSGVYFDVAAFERANNHYARLEPWNRDDEAKQAEGEGAITEKELGKNSDKRSNADFALWKISKPGEPSWPSPWGEGRPGWHIECSAMASDKLGSQFDIHSGGIDLAFPHHDNELAQSEAYWTNKDDEKQHQWVNYFMHMGHLSIAGAKMSKSLKNFTTIRKALSQGAWTSRGLRIVLLLGGWREGIEITDDLVKAGSGWEDKVNNFFIRSKDLLGDSTKELFKQLRIGGKAMHMLPKNPQTISTANGVTSQTNGDATVSLDQTLERTKSSSYLSLCDSFNTAAVMASISELITAYNAADPPPSSQTTFNIARWITSMVNMFGLNGSATPIDAIIGWSGLDIPESARPALTTISNLRDLLRKKARSSSGISRDDIDDAISTSRKGEDRRRSFELAVAQFAQIPDDAAGDYEATSLKSEGKSRKSPIGSFEGTTKDLFPQSSSPPQPFTDVLDSFQQRLGDLTSSSSPDLSKSVLSLCDTLRDTDLWDKGIYLEDREGDRPALIRLVTKELLATRQEKEEREQAKAKAKAEREADATAKADKGKVSEKDMFRTEEFGAWDDDGVPTKDGKGEELTKSRIKKLRKEWERQKRLHEAWVKEHGSTS